jgi:hypothetical protein
MAWPSDYSQVLVKGSWFDPFNQPTKGFVSFEPTIEIYDTFGQKIIPPAISGIPLVNGSFQTYLLATNEPNVTPKGWKYRVTVSVPGGGIFLLDVDKDSGEIDITDWKASVSTEPDHPVYDQYATLGMVEARIPKTEKGAPGGVATLDSSGILILEQFPSQEVVMKTDVGVVVPSLTGDGETVPYDQLPAPFVYEQGIPSAQWVINHGFPNEPTVEVYNNAGEEVDAEVVNLTASTVVVRCAYPETGRAVLRR